MRGGFARIYMSLPERIEGCPQHESMQPRCAYAPYTLVGRRKVQQKGVQVGGSSRGSRDGLNTSGTKRAQSTKKSEKTVRGPATQLHPAFFAGGSSSSRTNGSRYPREASNCLHVEASTQPQHGFNRLHQRRFSRAFFQVTSEVS